MQIGFIGVGKITNAIVEGLCTSSIENTQIYLSPRNEVNADTEAALTSTANLLLLDMIL